MPNPPSPRALTAAWLRAIPQSRHQPIPPRELPGGEEVGSGLVALLEAWGAVELSDAGIRAVSQPAYYFLHSLAAWMETEGSIITDWSEEVGARAGQGWQHGTSLVYLLESERVRRFPDAPAIRFTAVAEVLIVSPEQPRRFLVQWDERAGYYQVIGGRQKDDLNWQEPIAHTAARELEEELAYQIRQEKGDFTLEFLAEFEGEKHLSPSFGALTSYHFTFFQARNLPPIQLGPNDLWVTREELLAGQTEDGRPVRGGHIPPLEAKMGKTIDALPSSFREIPGDSVGIR